MNKKFTNFASHGMRWPSKDHMRTVSEQNVAVYSVCHVFQQWYAILYDGQIAKCLPTVTVHITQQFTGHPVIARFCLVGVKGPMISPILSSYFTFSMLVNFQNITSYFTFSMLVNLHFLCRVITRYLTYTFQYLFTHTWSIQDLFHDD